MGLLFLLPGGPLHAQQTAETYYHHENDMGPVVTLTANDPEDVTHIYWSFLTDATGDQDLPGGNATDDIDDLDIAHRAFFKVEDGVLSFEAKPDYEAGTPAPDDRMYKVVVQASDGGQMTWVQYFKVTVVVLDVEEQGKVTWTVNPDGTANGEAAGQNLLEFQAGAVLTATVTDPDGLPADDNDTWKWYRSSRNTGPWTMITSGDPAVPVITADYTASDHAENNDVGMYLRAVATYTDRRGDGKTAEFVSPHTVKATKVEDNSVPKFAPTAVERDIQEGPAGRNVGASVTATDADNDVLNYTLVTNVGDFFEIDQLTGQITTAALLDYENPGTDWATADDGTTKTIDVTVRATDSAGGNTVENGAPVDATVTITLLNVNEAPDFGVESRTLDSPANIQGMAADMAEEGVGRPWEAPHVVSAYTVIDPEGVVINEGKWSLAGYDAGKFKLTGAGDNTRTLEFIDKPDFEMPGDKNGDNIYEVTVVASDGEEQAMRAVTVKITDSDEAGMITLSNENPVAGRAITAKLEDSDGDVINVGWAWYALNDTQVAGAAAITLAIGLTGVDATVIEGAKSDTYTPVADDIGRHLVAVASYMDRTEDTDNMADSNNDPGSETVPAFIRFDNMAQSDPSAPVIDDPANAMPEFEEGDRAVRYVEEDDDSDLDQPNRAPETIGAPLMITDDDLPNDSHTWTLSGTDEASFGIDAATGQLMTKAALDFEMKDTYTVVVTVDDGSGESNDADRITVTIEVKALDEKPVIKGEANVEYNENGTGPVVTLTANDPEDVTHIYWSFLTDATGDQDLPGGNATDDIDDLDIAHRAFFKVEDGVLSFEAKPDYEAGTPAPDDRMYKVVVQASDGGQMTWVQYFKVTVVVLDVEEQGKVTWTVNPDGTANGEAAGQNLLEFQAGAVLTATVTDPDGLPADDNDTWKWYRSSRNTGPWTMITSGDPAVPVITADYTASDHAENNDVGMYLRAVATYTDGRGANKTAEFVSPHTVKATKVADNSVPEFAPTTHTRRVQEGLKGENVGGPVTATDADNDVLNYTLVTNVGDFFEIDQLTGQITTAALLDYENPGTDWATADDGTTKTIDVTVRATDSAGGNTVENGAPVDATVTITLLNVNEAPDFGVESRTLDSPANIQGMAADMAEEGVGRPWEAPHVVSAYTVIDPEGVVINEGKWSLAGYDAGKFKLTGAGDNTRTLEFIDKPDFEMPGDKNGDNIYEVTVVASDGEEQAMRAVTVKITDSDEAGMITLSNENPVAGRAITAKLEDSDGDVINVGWAWYALNDTQVAGAAAITLAIGLTGVDATVIEGAKSDTYTPVADDIGRHLVAVASYMDRTEDTDNMADSNNDPGSETVPAFIRFDNMAQSDPSAPVIDDPANVMPEFEEGDRAVRYVEEDDDSDLDQPNRAPETIGAPLMITDDDGMTATSHTWTLSGTDEASFGIDAATGQLMTKAALDFEMKDTYTVVVTVDDGSGESNDTDRITVTIEVKDLDEKPVIGEGRLAISGPGRDDYAEGRMDAVATYMASGPGSAMAQWMLSGDDAGDFVAPTARGASFTLAFRTPPNFNSPADADRNNVYEVTIQADDGTYTGMLDVTITVTNVDELGMVSGDATVSYPENGTEAVATYTADGPVMAAWSVSGADMDDFDINGGMLTFKASPDFETPTDADTDNIYQVTVQASAGGEMDEVAVTVTVTNVEELGTVSGDATVSYPENGTEAVATYTADRPVTAAWLVSGADMDDFSINNAGMLSFRTSPDYENPADDGMDNVYNVTVEANAGGEMGEVAITVAVTNENELGMVSGDETASYAEKGTDAVAAYTADGPDAASARWSVSGADMDDFDINGGMLTFKASPDFETPTDADTDNIYQVTVQASAGGEMDMMDVTITVTNVDEMGEVTLWAGTDALTMAPQVGDTITGAVIDPDSGVTGESWQWAKTKTPAMMDSWMPITGATGAAYMVTEGDTGYHLRVMATYTDAAGTDMAMEDSPATMMVTAMMTVPMFDSETATREVAENTEASMDIGAPVTATDADGDALDYTLGGTDAASFDINPETGQLKTLAALDYETKAAYEVMVTATDPDSASDMITVTITVTNVDEMGEVTLWAGADALTMAPQVGDTITGAVIDPDGGVTGESWQWAKTKTPDMMASWMDIDGETNAAYMVMEGDTGYSLRVMATYTDAVGTDMDMAYSMPTMMVTAVDEMGRVTLWAGADALTMAPQVGDTITGDVMDPDGGVTGETWQWARTKTPDMMASWMDIDGETNAAYMVMEGDTGYSLRVMATYTDAVGTDMDMAYSMPTMMVTAMMTVPMFDSETATREVAENTEASMDIGAPVTATDADGDALDYTLGGTDAASFDINPETGQLKTLAALDYETKAAYEVMVTATDPDSASDMITVTITVTNVDEMGEVTLWAGTDALTMAPQVGDTITGAVIDPDSGVTGESWQWAKTKTPAMMDSWMPITGATGAAYMVTEGDTGYHLRVMATYTDAAGTDMAMEDSPATMMVTAMMTVPMFDSETATREVAENTEASMDIGAPVTATDADGDALDYTLGGTDAASFDINPETGQLKTLAALDYETKAAYEVMVTATDPDSASDMITVTITVTNVDEMGEVTLWAGADALTMAPQVGDTITGAVIDPDGGVTGESWQWAKTKTPDMMASWMDIDGETNAAYMVMEGDTGYSLRVMATYTDAVGTDMDMAYSMPTMMVTAVDEMGRVTLWAGADALTMAPQVGDTITGDVMDPDGGVTGETWQWARTKTPDMMASWMDIDGETNAAYMVMEGDTGYSLRVMATYTDAVGTDMDMAYSMPTMMVTAVDEQEPEDPVERYDVNNSGRIDKDELADGVFDYNIEQTLSKDDLADLIFSYEKG